MIPYPTDTPAPGLEQEIAILRGLIQEARDLAGDTPDLKTRLALLDKVSLACGRLATLLKTQALIDRARAAQTGEQTRMERITRDVDAYLRQAAGQGDAQGGAHE